MVFERRVSRGIGGALLKMDGPLRIRSNEEMNMMIVKVEICEICSHTSYAV